MRIQLVSVPFKIALTSCSDSRTIATWLNGDYCSRPIWTSLEIDVYRPQKSSFCRLGATDYRFQGCKRFSLEIFLKSSIAAGEFSCLPWGDNSDLKLSILWAESFKFSASFKAHMTNVMKRRMSLKLEGITDVGQTHCKCAYWHFLKGKHFGHRLNKINDGL